MMLQPMVGDGPERIVPTGWDAQVAERFGYSFALRRGPVLWIAGQVAMDEGGRPAAVGDIRAQTRIVFARIRTLVEAAGGTMADIVRTTTYVTDREHRPVTNELRREFFNGRAYPTNTLLIVAGLALPEYLVEIDATAVLPT